MATNEWQAASFSHPGYRRPLNEDRYLIRSDDDFWLVADGMGGHHRGDFASNMVIEVTEELPISGSLTTRAEQVRSALAAGHERLRQVSANSEADVICGTTVTCLLIQESEGVVQLAGDSRLYRWRHHTLMPMTRDHSYVEELVQQGELSPKDAEQDPRQHIITRAIGMDQPLAIEQVAFSVDADDRFLLCTDGLFGELDAGFISAALGNASTADEAASALLEGALAGAADDNITGVVVFPTDHAPQT